MITVAGLGDGSPESLTFGVVEAITRGNRLRVLKDPQNAVYRRVRAAHEDTGYDRVLVDGDTMAEDSTEQAVRILIELAATQDVVYITPGDPLRDDPVTLMLVASAKMEGLDLTILSPGQQSPGNSTNDIRLLTSIMSRLRHPVRGCPWDLEQTLPKLKRYVLEEAYEVLEAIDLGDPAKHAEELGDLLLQIAFQSQLARESGDFDISGVISSINDKLLRRHPHVFGTVQVENTDEVLKNWEAIKRDEPGYEDRSSILDGIPIALPALMRALEVSKRVVKVGFEWPAVDQVLDKVEEELSELRAELATGDTSRAGEEIGDLLFTLVNVARQVGVDPEEVLRTMTVRFAARFRYIEQHAKDTGRILSDLSLAEMEEQWQHAKSRAK